jgi:4-hydroxybutyrate CoA-transferase
MSVFDWKDEYKSKLVNFEEAAKLVKSGDHLCYGLALAAPSKDFFDELVKRAEKGELEGVDMHAGIEVRPYQHINPETAKRLWGKINYSCGYGASGPMKKAFESRAVDFWPCNSPDYAMKQAATSDVFICQVTPPDARGYMNLGLINFYSLDVMRDGRASGRLREIIVEVNDQMPFCYGDNFVHVSEVDHIIEHSSPIVESSRVVNVSEIEQTIGNYTTELIPDRANFQMGWGGVSETVVANLQNSNLRDLGVISEMFPAGLNDLVEKGIVTNKYKPYFAGKSIAAICLGDKGLYDFVTENPRAEVHPSSVTNSIPLLMKHDNLIAINGALAIDMTGQIASEGYGHTMVSGCGGQMEFMVAAHYSKGGKAISVLRSTRKLPDGTVVSNIVAGHEHRPSGFS